MPPLSTEDEFSQRLTRPAREISLCQLLRQRLRSASIPNGEAYHWLVSFGYLVDLAGLIRQNSDHLMHGEAPRRGFQHQIPIGNPQIVNRRPIGLLIVTKPQSRDS